MTTEEKIKIFNQKWKMLISNIANSNFEHKKRKAIYLSGFYFTRAQVERHSNNYDCVVCYKDWEETTELPQLKERATKVIILKHELLNYCFNGWNKSDEIRELDRLYKECVEERKLLKEIYKKEVNQNEDPNDYLEEDPHLSYKDSGLLDIYERMSGVKKEKSRLLFEKTCVAILLKYMGLLKFYNS